MNSQKSTIFFAVLVIFIGFLIFWSQSREINRVVLGQKTFFVEIAKTNVERAMGLSLRPPLQEDQGMLFVFDEEGLQGFWMKDMQFSIDILWIDSNLRITHIEKSVAPETYPKTFFPPTKSLYVLEIPAGQADLLKIKTGDTVKFLKK